MANKKTSVKSAKKKTRATPKLTDTERHALFVETARSIGASENPDDFERAFKQIVPAKKPIKIHDASR